MMNRLPQTIAPANPPWDTELFVLQAESRQALAGRLASLDAFLARRPDVSLVDLACTLNTEPTRGKEQIALIAGSVADLRKRLARASNRLADPKCRQIKDSSGIFYFAERLHPAGKLAFLFPGEGAQYLNMLGDLIPHFPEVGECFAESDSNSAKMGGDKLSRFATLGAEADGGERQGAAEDIRSIGNAINSVLMADWAMLEIAKNLGLAADAVAGHSAGELAALWFAGSLDHSPFVLEQVGQMWKVLEGREESGVGKSVLVAAGASRQTMETIIAHVKTTGGRPDAEIMLAMDNCPHQTVTVGPPDCMTAVEAELTSRHIIFERLPFSRPYHTHLFEPFMGPLRDMFPPGVFHLPKIKIYSCSTGKPFPADPEQIRDLAVNHWRSAVEFTRMIDTMYADGVKFFIEVGPRGNLSSFVEDILRGKPFLSVPTNVQRRSGVTQLNHLAGQLSAHGVPLTLEHFYRRRDTTRIEWESPAPSASRPAQAPATQPSRPIIAPRPVSAPAAGRAAVMNQYMTVMSQFLATEQAVMGNYLARSPRRASSGRGRQPSDPTTRLTKSAPAVGRVPPPPQKSTLRPPASSLPPPASSLLPPAYPLLGEIVHHVPGRELVMRRRMDLSEDLMVNEHTVGGRNVSRIEPDQHGLPIMPMTGTLEMMAEAAAALVPGKVVLGLKKIQLTRWLAYDEADPTTVELSAKVLPDLDPSEPDATARVSCEVRDLGNAASSPGKGKWTAAVGTVLLGDRYPVAPAAEPFVLAGEHACKVTLVALYRNLFHGASYQGVESLGRTGDDGIEGRIRVLPRDRLFQSDPDPRWLIDPILLDIAMHPAAGWHLEHEDQSGRILLPFELGKLSFFGPPPAVGTELVSRTRIVHQSVRKFAHQVEVLDPAGRVWCKIDPVRCWRFYVPFGDVNFHGPKDEYFLTSDWPQGLPVQPGEGAKPESWCMRFDIPADLRQPTMQMPAARVTLSRKEIAEYQKLTVPDDRRVDWLFGRIAGKDAVRSLWWHALREERLFPSDIEIEADEHRRPIAVLRGRPRPDAFPNVSISHTKGSVAALASFSPFVGIDIERVVPREESFERIAFDDEERSHLATICPDRNEAIARFWCAKEAVGKALGRGLVEGPRSVAVCGCDPATGLVQVGLRGQLAALFPGLAGSTFLVRTLCEGDLAAAATTGERTAP